jgi:hypothetical protein
VPLRRVDQPSLQTAINLEWSPAAKIETVIISS